MTLHSQDGSFHAVTCGCPQQYGQQNVSMEQSLMEDFQKHPVLVLCPVANPSLILRQKAAAQPEHLHLPVH